MKASKRFFCLVALMPYAAQPASGQDGRGPQADHANGDCWVMTTGVMCRVDGRAVGLAGTGLMLSPAATASGADAGLDQERWRAALTAIQSSKSSAPTGTFDFTAYQDGALIEPGIYDVGGLTFGAGALRLRARIPGTVVIRIPPDQYFMTMTDKVESASVDGIIFVGGKGAFHYTYGRYNVAGMQTFTDNLFWGYKQAAIANEALDMPYFHIRDNIFYGTPSSIGVAIGGDLAGTVIESNAFLADAYHLALGPNFNGFVNILRNDFIAFGSNVKKADIWLKPGAVAGVTIEGNKFGSENNPPDTPRILIANEDPASGSDRASRRPSTTNAAGTVRGMTLYNNMTGESSRPTGAFIQSYVRDVQAINWRRNRFAGNPYALIVDFANGVLPAYTGMDSDFEFDRSDVSQPSRPAAGFSNVAFAHLRDYGGFWPGDPNAVEVYPVSDDPGLSLSLNALASPARSSLGRVTRVRAADPAGHQDFETVTVPAARNGEYAGFTGQAGGGRYTLELWLERAPAHSLEQLHVDVFNYRSNQVALSYDLTLPAEAGRFSVPFYLPPDNAPDSWQLRVYPLQEVVPGSSDSFQTGWWLVNSGWGRVGRERAAALFPVLPRDRTLTGGAPGAWPGGWSASGPAGTKAVVNRTGTDAHGDFLEVTLSGTATAAGSFVINLLSSVIEVSAGDQIWQMHVPVEIAGGSLTWATDQASDQPGPGGKLSLQLRKLNAAGTIVNALGAPFTPGASYASYGRGDMAIGAADRWLAGLRPVLIVNVPAGAKVDSRLRIYVPEIQRRN